MRALLAAAFVLVPLVEIWFLIQVGQVIGGWQTVVLLLVMSALGAWLVRREGRRTWTALQTALQTGRMPARELADAALVLVGGTLLLTPGFLTDLVGALVILPLTRPLARRLLGWFLARRVARGMGGAVRGRSAYGPSLDPFDLTGGAGRRRPTDPTGRGPRPGSAGRPGGRRGAAPGQGEVIPGEVVDRDEPTP